MTDHCETRPFALWAALALAVTMCSVAAGGGKDDSEAKRLEGRWVRPDGGYLLVIRDVQPDGKLTASYYNPRPINVHAATWKVEKGRLHLYVELRDRGYPGSKYSVVYMPDADALVGTYYQAVQKQIYNIRFLRKKESK